LVSPTPCSDDERQTGHLPIPKVAVPLARADGVVSHESALELLDLTDLIADEIHISPLRSGGWTEQTNLAIRQAIRRGLTTRGRLEAEVPAKWRPWLHGSAT
jgi:hypothetical protein